MTDLTHIHLDYLRELYKQFVGDSNVQGKKRKDLADDLYHEVAPKEMAKALIQLGFEMGDAVEIAKLRHQDLDAMLAERIRGEMLPEGPHKWLWVASKQSYLDDDGNDRGDLDPLYSLDYGSEGWWSCHKDTVQGDLVLLYRKRPNMDIAYLLQADSDAYSIADEAPNWEYGCDYRILHKFDPSLTLRAMRKLPWINEWSAYRGNFQGRAFHIPELIWGALTQELASQDQRFRRILEGGKLKLPVKDVLLESELEQALVDNPGLLEQVGYDVEIIGRQIVCAGQHSRIDVLGYDHERRAYVVIELKNVRACRNVFGQISSYLGWADKNYAEGTRGLVLARGFDNQFKDALDTTDRVEAFDIRDLGFQ